VSAQNSIIDESTDATVRAHEEGRAVLVSGVLALKELEAQINEQIQERADSDAPRSEVHPLRSAHAALIAARKELVMAEQRAAQRLRSLHRQQV